MLLRCKGATTVTVFWAMEPGNVLTKLRSNRSLYFLLVAMCDLGQKRVTHLEKIALISGINTLYSNFFS
jgi:hypothetical protein